MIEILIIILIILIMVIIVAVLDCIGKTIHLGYDLSGPKPEL